MYVHIGLAERFAPGHGGNRTDEIWKSDVQPTELRAVRSVRVCDHRDQENFSLFSIEYTLKVMPDSPACTHYKGRRTGGGMPLSNFSPLVKLPNSKPGAPALRGYQILRGYQNHS